MRTFRIGPGTATVNRAWYLKMTERVVSSWSPMVHLNHAKSASTHTNGSGCLYDGLVALIDRYKAG